MLSSYIEEYRSPRTPWEVYQSVHPFFEYSFFLDSVRYRHPNQRYSYIGFNPFLTLVLKEGKLRLHGKEKGVYPAAKLFEVLRRLFKRYEAESGAEFFTGGAVGFWGYELVRLFEKKVRLRANAGTGTPDLVLGFYKDLIVYDHKAEKYYLVTHAEKGKGFLKTVRKNIQKSKAAVDCHCERLKEAKQSGFPPHRSADPPSILAERSDCFDVRQESWRPPRNDGTKSPSHFRLRHFRPAISRYQFKKMVLRAKRYIEAGDIYQANLSQRFSFQFQGSALTLYGALRRINPSPFAAFLSCGDLQIVSSSPERLIRKKGAWCETRPIAGTRGKLSGKKAFRKLKKELLANPKERAEHLMLVDLERNDLGKVCDYETVKVEEMFKIEEYSHVIHLVSKIVGRLSKDKDVLDLVKAVFPGGTITGCPKIRCMQIIDELEPVRRGIYTGSVGYLDFNGDLDLNIIIRTIVLNKHKGHFQVGAGIVYDSDPEREYEETLHKGEALAEALAGVTSAPYVIPAKAGIQKLPGLPGFARGHNNFSLLDSGSRSARPE